jgi:hypothetical protein
MGCSSSKQAGGDSGRAPRPSKKSRDKRPAGKGKGKRKETSRSPSRGGAAGPSGMLLDHARTRENMTREVMVAAIRAVHRQLGERFGVIGAAAMAMHNINRQTSDLDIVVPASVSETIWDALINGEHIVKTSGGGLGYVETA